MRILLFCENAYAPAILRPLYDEAVKRDGNTVLWFVDTRKIKNFPFKDEVNFTTSIRECEQFSPDAIFVPGNIVPYWLPGVKVQIFHGYAGEKKSHFRIRDYFDLYLTQGPYFTNRFSQLAKRHGNFEVMETGWTKQDWIVANINSMNEERENLLRNTGKQRIVLYAPTFSPRLTSIPHLRREIEKMLDANRDLLLLIKFHPLTKKEWTDEYRDWAKGRTDVIFIEKEHNVTEIQLMSDLMISDTSSVVYEFQLLGRPAVTFRSTASEVHWTDISAPGKLVNAIDRALSTKPDSWVKDNYDPHFDGKCCSRMLDAVADYISRHGVPSRRKLNLWRRYKCRKTFGF